ncbi:MAG TPA: TAXI family TRAP transporter solute-binding subunit, partial [Candidatus Binatia bacterium]|nr:TAXI family TRAP transporter solute-binding subunit [Candidatus Binatia bacterium]
KGAVMTIKRYNSGIQRAKGFLELAAALYDSSLSSESWKAAEGVLQTDARLGNALRLSLTAKSNDRKGLSLSFATGSFREISAVAEGKFSLAWVNPSVLLTMAYRGKGPFRKRLPLRTLAVFPSYDVMGFAVHESTGITSLSQIKKERFPLKLSTRLVTPSALRENSTMFTVAAVMRAAGFTFAELRKWGGKIHLASRPSDPARRASIEKGTVNAIFDEGIKSWARTALENGFRFLPVEGAVLKRLVAMGYRPTVMSKSRFPGMAEDITTIDFSGWPMIVRADMPDEAAYAICEAIEKRKEVIPTDNYKPLEIAQLFANDEEAPYDVPLHTGAERFYREKGYLK